MTLSKTLRKAIDNYYENRSLASAKKWDKTADLKRINKVAAKQKLGFCASAGTFWFTYITSKGRDKVTLKICRELWPYLEIMRRRVK